MISARALTTAVTLGLALASCSERSTVAPGIDASIGFDSGSEPEAGADSGALAKLYACSSTALYRFDPAARSLTRVADFRLVGEPPGSAPPILELAAAPDGRLLAASADTFFDVDPPSAVLTRGVTVTGLRAPWIGLTFTSASSDTVLALFEDGTVATIDTTTGMTTPAGALPTGVRASGDVLALDGLGTFATTFDPSGGSDHLTRLGASLTTASPIGSGTGFYDVLGLAYARGTFFGFTAAGAVIAIDPTLGTGTLLVREATAARFEGAAVTPAAPSIP